MEVPKWGCLTPAHIRSSPARPPPRTRHRYADLLESESATPTAVVASECRHLWVAGGPGPSDRLARARAEAAKLGANMLVAASTRELAELCGGEIDEPLRIREAVLRRPRLINLWRKAHILIVAEADALTRVELMRLASAAALIRVCKAWFGSLNVILTSSFSVVDVQNDFAREDGALSVPDGMAVVPVINKLLEGNTYDGVVATQDWHPPLHCSFSAEPEFRHMSWPPHCVAGTFGADFVGSLRLPPVFMNVRKGAARDVEALSAFVATGLADALRDAGVSEVHVCGLALDYCVSNTALDAAAAGFSVSVIENATRFISSKTSDEAWEKMAAAKIARI